VIGPEAPVKVEVFREKRSRDQARAIVHEPLFEQLAHARVDEGIAREPLLPGLDVRPGVAPPIAAWTEVLARHLRSRGEELMSEVPPTQLTDELLRTGSSSGGLDDLQRRDTAEVEVRREQGRGVGSEVVSRLRVLAKARLQPGRESATPFRFTTQPPLRERAQ